jgi:hypothetical protein
MEQTNINVLVESNETPQRAILAGAERAADIDAFNPETEARQLLELMGAAGVLPPDTVNKMLGTPQEIEEAEIIEENE